MVLFKGSWYFQLFQGIWSSTALFTHTPLALLGKTIQNVTNFLNSEGLFFVSYTTDVENEGYDKLLLSSTGRIKYFSRPKAEQICIIAERNGLMLKY